MRHPRIVRVAILLACLALTGAQIRRPVETFELPGIEISFFTEASLKPPALKKTTKELKNLSKKEKYLGALVSELRQISKSPYELPTLRVIVLERQELDELVSIESQIEEAAKHEG